MKTSALARNPFNDQYKIGTPFDLDDEPAYQSWVEEKMDNYPQHIEDIIVEVANPADLSTAEIARITQLCKKTNMVIYAGNTGTDDDKEIPTRLGRQFKLYLADNNRGADDGITALRVVNDEWRSEYIPYTNHLIHWHTDGYYNAMNYQIRALLLHCVQPASSGGENALLDHEIAYIHLRQKNPAYIRALMAADAMTIPANINKQGEIIRPERCGPVFSVDADGKLHMRYTARTRSIIWKDDDITRQAVKQLADFLASDSPYIFRGTLQSGQGLISNNVLHDRSAFEETGDTRRLLYRLRYFQRIAAT